MGASRTLGCLGRSFGLHGSGYSPLVAFRTRDLTRWGGRPATGHRIGRGDEVGALLLLHNVHRRFAATLAKPICTVVIQ